MVFLLTLALPVEMAAGVSGSDFSGKVTLKVDWSEAKGQYLSIKDTGPGIPESEIPVVLFDVEIFTAVYFHAADRASAQQLNQHADHFEREVSDLVKSVAASVSSLHDTAQSMSARM